MPHQHADQHRRLIRVSAVSEDLKVQQQGSVRSPTGWAGARLVVLGQFLPELEFIEIFGYSHSCLTRPRSPLQKQQSQRSRRARICFPDALTHSFGLTCPRLIAILDPSSYLTFPFSFLLLSLCKTADLDEAYSCRSQTQAGTTSSSTASLDWCSHICRSHTHSAALR